MRQLFQNVPGRESRAIENFQRVPLQSPCPIQNQHRRAGFKRFLTRGVDRSRSLTPALVERPSLAQRVIDEDDEVDRLELEIDDMSDSHH